MFLHVIEARCAGGYRVELSFNDGRRGTADLKDALRGPMFEPLKDPAVFAKLRVDPELGTITWPNGADLAPEFLYFKAFADIPELHPRFIAWGYMAPRVNSAAHTTITEGLAA